MRKVKKLIAVTMSFALATGMLIGCGSNSSSGSSSKSSSASAKSSSVSQISSSEENSSHPAIATVEPKAISDVTVGISSYDESNENCLKLDTTIVNGLEALGATVVLSDAAVDSNEQANHFENFIAQGVDIIVSLFVDQTAMETWVDHANEAGIPVIGVTTRAINANLYYVGTDVYDLGVMEADVLAEALPEGGDILYITNLLGRESTTLERNGLIDRLDEIGYDYNILSEQVANDVETSMNVCEDWITAYDSFDAIVAQTDLGILGAIQSLKAANREALCISIDGTSDAIAAIVDGDLYATIGQDWVAMGEKCVEVIEALFSGEKVDEENIVACYAVTADNVEQYM